MKTLKKTILTALVAMMGLAMGASEEAESAANTSASIFIPSSACRITPYYDHYIYNWGRHENNFLSNDQSSQGGSPSVQCPVSTHSGETVYRRWGLSAKNITRTAVHYHSGAATQSQAAYARYFQVSESNPSYYSVCSSAQAGQQAGSDEWAALPTICNPNYNLLVVQTSLYTGTDGDNSALAYIAIEAR